MDPDANKPVYWQCVIRNGHSQLLSRDCRSMRRPLQARNASTHPFTKCRTPHCVCCGDKGRLQEITQSWNLTASGVNRQYINRLSVRKLLKLCMEFMLNIDVYLNSKPPLTSSRPRLLLCSVNYRRSCAELPLPSSLTRAANHYRTKTDRNIWKHWSSTWKVSTYQMSSWRFRCACSLSAVHVRWTASHPLYS